jgi:hypothetical protein
METYEWARMLLRKENQSLPMQSGKAHNGTKTFATYKIKCDYLILCSAVEIAVGSEAQPARLLKLRQAICCEHAYKPSAVGIVFSDGRDGVGHPERALARYDDIAIGRYGEIEWAQVRIVRDKPVCPRAICRRKGEDAIVAFSIGTNTRSQEKSAVSIEPKASRKGHDPGP